MSLEWITSFLTFFLGITLGILIQRYWLDRTSRAAKLESELTSLKHQHHQMLNRVALHKQESINIIKGFQAKSEGLIHHFESLVLEQTKELPKPTTSTETKDTHSHSKAEESLKVKEYAAS
jgi:uncharacterized membrane-anchored protein YhcB (DUF1043 family)